MRLLFTTILLLFVASLSTGQNQPQPHNKSGHTEQKATDPKSDVPPTIPQIAATNAESEGRDKQTKSEHKTTICGFTLFELTIASLTAIYVFLTGLYAYTSHKTLEAMKQQGDNTARSVKLQAIALRQWIKIGRWGTELSDPDKQPESLTIGFEIINPTRAPIILQWAKITTAKGETLVKGFVQDAMLIPEHAIQVDVECELSSLQQMQYSSRDGLTLPVKGAIRYTDALSDAWEQRFNLLLKCNSLQTEPSEYIHTLHPIAPK
jgi:hypothetical protein